MDTNRPVRGPHHRDALDMCHKVLAGERSAQEAEVAFLAAIEEASGSA